MRKARKPSQAEMAERVRVEMARTGLFKRLRVELRGGPGGRLCVVGDCLVDGLHSQAVQAVTTDLVHERWAFVTNHPNIRAERQMAWVVLLEELRPGIAEVKRQIHEARQLRLAVFDEEAE